MAAGVRSSGCSILPTPGDEAEDGGSRALFLGHAVPDASLAAKWYATDEPALMPSCS